jgi:hypothetical protein
MHQTSFYEDYNLLKEEFITIYTDGASESLKGLSAGDTQAIHLSKIFYT